MSHHQYEQVATIRILTNKYNTVHIIVLMYALKCEDRIRVFAMNQLGNRPIDMESLNAVKLTELMLRTQGNPQITISLIDGPIVSDHPALAQAKIEQLSSTSGSACTQAKDKHRHPLIKNKKYCNSQYYWCSAR